MNDEIEGLLLLVLVLY